MNKQSVYAEALDYLRDRRKTNLIIIIINIVVFVVLNIIGNTENGTFMLQYGAVYAPSVMQGEYWRLLTAMFLHFDLQHLLFNMLCLLMLGDMLESAVGSIRYLLIYLLGGLGGNVLSLIVHLQAGSLAVSAGASGAIFAVVAACAYLAFRKSRALAAVPTKRILLAAALMLAEGFTQSGIDNAAHIGGALTGLVLTAVLANKYTIRR